MRHSALMIQTVRHQLALFREFCAVLALLVISQSAMAQPEQDRLHWLVQRGDVEGVSGLLGAGASPDQPSRLGVRPIELAASHGHAELIRILAASGADIHAADSEWWPAVSELDNVTSG